MQNVRHIKDQGIDAVVIPAKEWEKIQRELVRLRKRANKERTLSELRETLIRIKTDIKDGRTPQGQDADEFIAELMNAK